jgi:hypothetical protein
MMDTLLFLGIGYSVAYSLGLLDSRLERIDLLVLISMLGSYCISILQMETGPLSFLRLLI